MVLSLCIVLYAGCTSNRSKPPADELISINLSNITGVHQVEQFKEVKRKSLLPRPVLDYLGPIADPGEPFNSTDAVGPNEPRGQLIVAATSTKYCIVTRVQGGYVISFLITVFEFDQDNARPIFESPGTSRNLRDLKEGIESGMWHNTLSTRTAK